MNHRHPTITGCAQWHAEGACCWTSQLVSAALRADWLVSGVVATAFYSILRVVSANYVKSLYVTRSFLQFCGILASFKVGDAHQHTFNSVVGMSLHGPQTPCFIGLLAFWHPEFSFLVQLAQPQVSVLPHIEPATLPRQVLRTCPLSRYTELRCTLVFRRQFRRAEPRLRRSLVAPPLAHQPIPVGRGSFRIRAHPFALFSGASPLLVCELRHPTFTQAKYPAQAVVVDCDGADGYRREDGDH